MIQVAERSLAHGWTKTIRIHDLLRDWCISEAEKDGFLNVCGSPMDSSSVMAARRLALHGTTIDELPVSPPNLHTLLHFKPDGDSSRRSVSKFKSLRVFEQESENYFFIKPEGFKSMIHLRYLGFKGRGETRDPSSSIGNLCNLITLDLRNSVYISEQEYFHRLPDALWKIRTLRNLYFEWGGTCVKPPTTFCLENLQELIYVRAGKWIGKSLAKHNNLRKLGIQEISDSHHKELATSLGKLHRLVSLKLYFTDESSIPTQVLIVFPSQHHLRTLKLRGPLSTKLPTSSEFPPNLTKLTLLYSGLEQDPMPTLEKLPNLVYLYFFRAYLGKSMSCSVGGFPRLQHLNLSQLTELEDWSVEGGAMPNLTHLNIRGCSRLTMLPEGLAQMTNLRELLLLDDSEGLKGRAREGNGEDWYKIQHVPSIIIRG